MSFVAFLRVLASKVQVRTNAVLLLDNWSIHSAKTVRKAIKELQFEIVKNQPYCP